jgi:hypothetical protein
MPVNYIPAETLEVTTVLIYKFSNHYLISNSEIDKVSCRSATYYVWTNRDVIMYDVCREHFCLPMSFLRALEIRWYLQDVSPGGATEINSEAEENSSIFRT